MLSTLLVGFGFSAKTFHLPFLNYNDQLTVSGVVSSRPDAVASVLPDIPVYSNLADGLSHAAPDLCIITTPNHLHADQVSQCLTAGSHVLVEKPFTLSLADATALVAQARLSKTSLHVFHNRRFDGDFLTVQRLLSEQQLGAVRRMVSRFDRFRPVPRDRWRENAGPGAGIFWDLGPHLIDQSIQLFGMPEAVQANIQTLRPNGQSDDCFDVTLFYPDKQVAVGSSAFQAGKTLRFDVQGDKGSYRKYGLDPQEQLLRDGVSLTSAQWGQEDEESYGMLHCESGSTPVTTVRGDYREFYRQLVTSLTTGDASPCSADSVVPVIQVMEQAWQSHRDKRRVEIIK